MTFLLLLLFVLLGLMLLYLIAIAPRLSKKPDASVFRSVLFAHRGLYDNRGDAPENSMAAFRKAIEHGYGIELDVQLTKDGMPVVLHDYALQRMARYDHGKEADNATVNADGSFGVGGLVSDYTYAELQRFHLLHSAERIPLLLDVLRMVNAQVPLLIEIKSEDRNMEVCVKTQRLLRAYRGVFCIESFNPLVLSWYKQHAPEVFRGQLSDAFAKEDKMRRGMKYKILEYLLLNFLSKPDFIAYNHKYADNLSFGLCCNLFKAHAAFWTVTSQEVLDKLRRMGAMVIFEGFMPDK